METVGFISVYPPKIRYVGEELSRYLGYAAGPAQRRGKQFFPSRDTQG